MEQFLGIKHIIMKINKTLTLLLLTVGFMLLSTSCTREEWDNLPVQKEPVRVPVSLSLSVADMEAGTPDTKTVIEPDNGITDIQSQIKNFVVLQFSANGEKELVANPTFVEGDALDNYFRTLQVDLLPSRSDEPEEFVFVVVANYTNKDVFPGTKENLGAFIKRFQTITNYEAVFNKTGENQYLMMSGYAKVSLPKNLEDLTHDIMVTLKRNVSKITINVKNETGGEVTVDRVQLRDINAKYYFLTNIDPDIAIFKDDYSPANPFRFDKDQEKLPEQKADGSYDFTFYVPANLRGTISDDHTQYTKGKDAPEGATRFCLYGRYGSDNTPINYTYYLGGNLTNDFDLKPNYHYTYKIKLTPKDDARFDYRIEDQAEVKFHVDANSYMVHPPKVSDQSRIYAIPIRRAATFWNDPGVNGGVYGANKFDTDEYDSCKIDSETEWTAEVLWSDFKINNPSEFLTVASGKGYDPTDPAQTPYFKIKVKNGMKGNVIIAVKKKDSDTILWSWHIWITDYNPDRENLTPEQGIYIYDVDGGHVHRYNNTIFNTEATDLVIGYKDGFIMDRNLGASSDTHIGYKGTMYYQYGRKDPFGVYNQNGLTRIYDHGSTSTTYTFVSKEATHQPNFQNVRYAVCNPTTYLTGEKNSPKDPANRWTDNDDLADLEGVWFDRKFYEHNGNQEILEKKKSIYDPCPPGWHVPTVNVFFTFSVTSTTGYNTNYSLNRDNLYVNTTDKDYGFTYFPGRKTRPEQGSIYFPAHGYRSHSGADLSLEVYCRLRTTSRIEDTRGYILDITSKTAVRTSTPDTYAAPVRCAREHGPVIK